MIDKDSIVLEGKYVEMCTTWQLRRNMIVLFASMSICSFCSYLNQFNLKYLKGSLIENTVVLNITNIVSALLAGYVYIWLGCRNSMLTMLLMAVLGNVLLLIYF